jgi:sodium-dependent phosphate cotransporter
MISKTGSSNKDAILKIVALILLVYLFIVSIKLMGESFKGFKDIAVQLVNEARNPFVGLLIGILATSIVQSSSTTTTTVVTIVASGVLPIDVAIPMIMGANIGTSVTNTIVSLGNIQREVEFKRAFSASTVHDFFNMMCVLIFFPLQISTGFLSKSAEYMTSIFGNMGGAKLDNVLKVIIGPSLDFFKMITFENTLAMLLLSLVLIFIVLKYLSSTLRSVFVGRLENAFEAVIFKNYATSFTFGLVLTVLVQSSSISTSIIVPLAGAGFVTLAQILPYTIGANIGTTTTGLLAAMITGEIAAMTVAFAHFLFNIFGALIIYPLRKIPIYLAMKLSELAVIHKAIPIAYVIVAFFLLPMLFISFTN